MTPTELAAAAKISIPYASQIMNGKRKGTLETALRIYDATGHQFGPLSNLTARDIEAQRRLAAKQAA